MKRKQRREEKNRRLGRAVISSVVSDQPGDY